MGAQIATIDFFALAPGLGVAIDGDKLERLAYAHARIGAVRTTHRSAA